MSKQFITLTDVKINNDYTYVRAVAPTASEKAPTYSNGETWLNTVTGYSYELTEEVGGTWTQIELDIDNKINYIQSSVFTTVINYLGNYFTLSRVLNYFDEYETDWPDYFQRLDAFMLTNYESVYSENTFSASAGTITVDTDALYGSLTDTFAVGDTVLVSRTRRNNGYYTVSAVAAGVLSVSETLADEVAPSFLFFADVPAAFTQLLGRLIWYDIYSRVQGAGLKSERVGTYSFTMQDADTALGYPSDITGGLSSYMGIITEGVGYFVN